MIVAQFHDIRRFMGRLDHGQDVIQGLKTVCLENSIHCGWLSAGGILQGVMLESQSDHQTILIEERLVIPSIFGNISILREDTDIRLYGGCYKTAEGRGYEHFAGLIRKGEVISFEFMLMAVDDVYLVRDPDVDPILCPWMMVQPGTVKPIQTTVVKNILPTPQKPAQVSLRQLPSEEDDISELQMLSMKVGDYIDHPRFGKCKIVQAPQDEKLGIRLPTGKQVNLHLGIMRIHPPIMEGDHRIFRLEIKPHK